MKKRAIQVEDKETKRKQIVYAARTLFTERDFFAVKMEDVATKAGVAKGTLYLYFGTKEELFLDVAETEIAEWFDSLYGAMDHVARQSPEQNSTANNIPHLSTELSSLLSATLKKHPTIPRDLSLLFNILEHNVSDDKMLAFKSHLIARLDTLCEHFTRLLGCHDDACWRLQLGLQSIMLGAWQLSKPSEKAKIQLLSQPSTSRPSPSFEEFLEWCVKNLVAGFLSEPSSFNAGRA